MSRLQSLRAKHKALHYRGVDASYQGNTLEIFFDFFLEPDITFAPSISLPSPANKPELAELMPYIYETGLIELMSYWKAACPEKIVLKRNPFSKTQLEFWKLLYRNGLSEFFYNNEIDPAEASVTFEYVADAHKEVAQTLDGGSGSLLMVSGGKDSTCLLDLYSAQGLRSGATLFHVKADVACERLANLFNFPKPLLGVRKIDPLLLRLNTQGYLNGHTPFSACLAFTGLLTAKLWGKEDVVVANESSANEESFIHNGLPINHQFSKSIQFEQAFRKYASETFKYAPNYFSALRTLDEDEICAWFAALPLAHPVFRSCNRAAKNDAWCGECPKCSFVALMLASYIGLAGLYPIFGFNPFEKVGCIENCVLLLQEEGSKPLDCVGTYAECQRAISRMKARFPADVPQKLKDLPERILSEEDTTTGENNIPKEILENLQVLLNKRIAHGS